ncbi:3'5'-cyclic nucleotide phosphodiesterase [Pelomyxa schiedti]|nr:3'5'-cyclic nucleotide phosphodiesterase [Pelomyxa schiedti]
MNDGYYPAVNSAVVILELRGELLVEEIPKSLLTRSSTFGCSTPSTKPVPMRCTIFWKTKMSEVNTQQREGRPASVDDDATDGHDNAIEDYRFHYRHTTDPRFCGNSARDGDDGAGAADADGDGDARGAEPAGATTAHNPEPAGATTRSKGAARRVGGCVSDVVRRGFGSQRVRFIGLSVAIVVITGTMMCSVWYVRSVMALDSFSKDLNLANKDAIGRVSLSVVQTLDAAVETLLYQFWIKPELRDPTTATTVWRDMMVIQSTMHLQFLVSLTPEDPDAFDPAYCYKVIADDCPMVQTVILPYEGSYGVIQRSKEVENGTFCGFLPILPAGILLKAKCDHFSNPWGWWLMTALETGEIFNDTHYIHFGKLYSGYFISLTRVMFGDNGKPLTWVTAAIDTPQLTELLKQVHLGEAGFGYIIDSKGKLIAFMGNLSVPSSALGAISPAQCNETKILETLKLLTDFDNDLLLLDKIIEVKFLYEEQSYDVMASDFRPFGNVSWTIVISTESNDAYIHSVTKISTLFTLGVIVALLGFAVISSLSLTAGKRGIGPEHIDLDSGMKKVMEELREVRKRVSGKTRDSIEHIIESLSCTEGLFRPDLKHQKKLFDKDIQLWLNSEITPGFQDPPPKHINALTSAKKYISRTPSFEDLSILQKLDRWDFIDSEGTLLEKGGILSAIAIEVLSRLDVFSHVRVEVEQLRQFFEELESNYRTIPYHNLLHAVDVVQCLYFFLTHGLLELLGPCAHLDIFSMICAAVGHDVSHPGVNNAFLVNSCDPLAVQFNDRSVLENYHASFTIRTLLQHASHWALKPEDLKLVRSNIIELILSTDISRHFELLSKFQTLTEGGKFDPRTKSEHRLQLMNMALKAADISNCMRPHQSMLFWVSKLVDEFFCQGDLERERNLPASPFTDRDTGLQKLPKLQTNFISLLARPLILAIDAVSPQPHAIACINANLEYWSRAPCFTDTDTATNNHAITEEAESPPPESDTHSQES